MQDTKAKEQNAEEEQNGHDKPIFPFIEDCTIEEDYEQIEMEEAYQGF
ncbi:MAG: hypothetical protein K2L82_03080 [Lachnospiraceae bacterium]|nr:hypothetical protein [Lachnospiraceae bacterium]